MINFDDYTNESNGVALKTQHNLKYTNNRSFRIWKNECIIKFNKQPAWTDKIYLYTEDPNETKCHYLINKCEKVVLYCFNDPQAFIEYSNDMQDVYKNIEEYNTDKESKILIVFDDMIADMINTKKLNSIVTYLFIRGRKLNISVFTTQSYFKVPKHVRLHVILPTFSLWKFWIKENFNKLH